MSISQTFLFAGGVFHLAIAVFQKPIVPEMSKNLSSDVQQFSAESYRNPSQIPAGNVVVVGDYRPGK